MPDISARAAGGIRDAGPEDIPAIAKLFAEVEPEDPITPAQYDSWWRWLHVDNPTHWRLALGSFAADGECRGHLAMIPFAFSIDGEDVNAGFSCQLMVTEKQRQSLIYPTLVQKMFREYPARGVVFAYSTVTRPRVKQSNLALGFKAGPELPIRARPYRTSAIAKRVLGAWAQIALPFAPLGNQVLKTGWPISGAVKIEAITTFPHEVDELWVSLKPRFKLIAVRTADVLNWRFFGNKARAYKAFLARRDGAIVGYAVVRAMPMQGFSALALVDLLHDPDDDDVGDALLDAVHTEAKQSKVDLASACLSETSPFAPRLARWGFLRTPESFTLIAHEPRGQARVIKSDPRDWHVTWFDHDFV